MIGALTSLFLFFLLVPHSLWARGTQNAYCEEQWPAAERKLTDLRKTIGCDMHYNMSECIVNLGLAGGAAGAVGYKIKKGMDAGKFRVPFKAAAPESCGIFGSNTPQYHRNYLDWIISTAEAKGPGFSLSGHTACNTYHKVKPLSDKLKAQMAAHRAQLQKEVDAMLKDKGLSKVLQANPRLLELHREEYNALRDSYAETDPVKAAKIDKKITEATAKIEMYLKSVSRTQENEVKTLSGALRATFLARNPEAGVKYWESKAPKTTTSEINPKLAALEAQIAETEKVEARLIRFGPTTENLAREIEAAAKILPESHTENLLKMRIDLAEGQEIRTSQFSRLFSNSRNKGLLVPEARVGSRLAYKVVGMGLGMGVTFLAEASVGATTTGCSTISSQYVNKDKENDCKPKIHMDDDFKEFLTLEPEAQKRELCNVPDLNKVISDYHATYFPSDIKVSCGEGKVSYTDNHRRSTEEMTFDESGNPKQYAYKVSNDIWNDTVFDFENNQVKKMTLKGRDRTITIPPERLATTKTPGFDYATTERIFNTDRVRLLEYRSCCTGEIGSDDSRCEALNKSEGHDSSSSGNVK